MKPKYFNKDNGLLLLYCILLVSIIFTFRAVTSVSLALIIFYGISKNKTSWNSTNILFIIIPLLYYLWEFIQFREVYNKQEFYRHAILHLGIILIPLALITTSDFIKENALRLKAIFVSLILLAFFISLISAFSNYLSGRSGTEIFFYHKLVQPLGQHAVVNSILCFIAMMFTIECNRLDKFPKKLSMITITALLIFVFMLSSKLVIAFSVMFLALVLLLTKPKLPPILILILCVTALLFAVFSPVTYRFKEILNQSAFIGKNKIFDPNVYFNGLEFRLLQWKLVPEILNEKKAWITGVGTGDAQDILDAKYRSLNMYQGNGGEDFGYLGYNPHNQFLQSLLQSGIIGLVLFTGILILSMITSFKVNNIYHRCIMILIGLYCFNESVFETQYGIILFSLFPLFGLLTSQNFSREKSLRANLKQQSFVYQ